MDEYGKFLKNIITKTKRHFDLFGFLNNDPDNKLDLFIQNEIINVISQKYPKHNIIAEENGIKNTDLAEFTWVIDPIDGSENFYRGIFPYCISICLFFKNKVLLGAVFEPCNDRLFFAGRGQGATLNGTKMEVSKLIKLDEIVVALSRKKSFNVHNNGNIFDYLMNEIHNVRISCSSALDMCNVAKGAIEARILANTRIWDSSAGTLIIEEAGGVVTDWAGNTNKYFSPLIIASNSKCHKKLLELIQSSKTKRKIS